MNTHSTGHPARLCLRAAVLVLLLCGAAGLSTFGDVVEIPDAKLATVLRSALGKPSGDLLDTDLARLVSLHAGARDIANLEGLQYCVNLKRLWLFSNKIVNIEPLARLTKLWRLDLSGNQIVNVTALAGLKELSVLDLSNNQVADIYSLTNLLQLTTVNLQNNRIYDLAPLLNNPGLDSGDYIDLRGNQLFLVEGSTNMVDIQTLQDRGIGVDYEPRV